MSSRQSQNPSRQRKPKVKKTTPERKTAKVVNVFSMSPSKVRNPDRVCTRNSSSYSFIDSDNNYSYPTFTCRANNGRLSRIEIIHGISAPYQGTITGTTLRGSTQYNELSSGPHDIIPGTYQHEIKGSTMNTTGATTTISSRIRYYY